MTQTIQLSLPHIDAAQAQKHITHNEALQILDTLAQLSVIARDQAAPPSSPVEGDRYIVGAGATGAFLDKDGTVAAWLAGAWSFFTPRAGWLAYVQGEALQVVHDGAAWVLLGSALGSAQNLSLLGVGATADSVNRLSVKSNAALFAAKTIAEGGSGDLRVAFEKEAIGATASHVFQTGFSGRAEIGLIGGDDLGVKVSADGSSWRTALEVDRTTGRVAFPSGSGDGSLAGFRNRLRNASFKINSRRLPSPATLAAGAFGHDGLRAGAAGATYSTSSSGVDAMLTISAGSIVLPVDAAQIEGGAYVLSHAGTAQARIWQTSPSGAFASVPSTGLVVAGLSACALTGVEFSTGTVLRPQLEPGVYPSLFERRPRAVELALCERRNDALLVEANLQQRNWVTSNAWLSSASAADNAWRNVCWARELGVFVAIASSGTGNRVMTSPDGVAWTVRTSAEDNTWLGLCWSPEIGLLVAVASDGTNRVMTSPDGIAWTARPAAAANQWRAVCWARELGVFVAVSSDTTSNRVMTSPDGVTWTSWTAQNGAWWSVCWSRELGLLVAVANSGTSARVMTSPDGVGWTVRADTGTGTRWTSVCWARELGLLVAVANGTGTGNRVMTSPDGVTWSVRTSAEDNSWHSVAWAPEIGLLAAVAIDGTNRVMTSPDGVAWTARSAAAANSWYGACWSPELGLFASVAASGAGNRAMTSRSAFSYSYR
ncbi:DUF2793 domain-containing protein [Methylosinus sp. Sm6]|uniref:DUF2793 domain-containing protein n=1 Tax=Methylosinus sp. Sm6 TaxID=2866948 RepID=UPI001C99FAAC|nr:DUF2793 domain-containing protein [Methylosinus sp. Sm6]MBY6239759.1 DUF2793 domain-containing protein [Methylosinus sp. Sm6]